MSTQAPDGLDPIALLDEPPEDEFALLELRIDWRYDLDIHPQKMQLWLRFFVMTEDPLGWIADRGEAWAATNVDDEHEVLELDVYVLRSALVRELEAHDGDLGAAVGHWAAPAMLAGLKYELVLASGEYFDRAVAGALPRLLDGVGGDRGEFGSPTIQVRQPWGPFGLGALQDLVQEAFGSVELDRSKVQLDPSSRPTTTARRARARSSRSRRASRTRATTSAARTRRRRRPSTPSASRTRASPTRPAGGRSTRRRCGSTSCASRRSRRSRRAGRRRRAGAQRPLPLRQRQEVQALPRRVARVGLRRMPVHERVRRMRSLSKLPLAGLTVLVALVLAACGGEATKDLATLKGDGFTVSMPGKPERSEQSVPTAKGTVKAVSYTSDSDDQAFSIGYTSCRRASRATCTGRSRAARRTSAARSRTRRQTTYQGFKARDARITNAADNKGTLFVRAILAEGRLYVLQFIGEGKNLKTAPDAYTEIVNSLKIG